jgi:hypothetical protein
MEPECIVRITSDDDYTEEYTYHEWSFMTNTCTDIRKCKGEGEWIEGTPEAIRAFFLMGAPYDHTSDDCRCLLWFENGSEGTIGSADGNEIITDGPTSYDLAGQNMRHYWLHCQVNFAHQLSHYQYDDASQ